MKHLLSICAFAALAAGAQAQRRRTQTGFDGSLGIGSAQYSGIAPMGGNRYAVVSDKEPKDGFFIFRIDQHPATGEVNQRLSRSLQGQSFAPCECSWNQSARL